MSYPVEFVKSTYCDENSACLEFAASILPGEFVFVRNSLDVETFLSIERSSWTDFIAGVKEGVFK
ncbi:DUF397 domain-containing protein [Streptomyces phaeochromogenes]